MRPSRIVVFGLMLFATSAAAQDAEPEADPEPEFECSQKDLPAELSQLCASFDLGYSDAMSRPAQLTGSGRPNLRPSLVRKPISSQVTASGLAPAPALDRVQNPFDGPSDRTVGVQVNTTGAPVQFSTQMVQPGVANDTALNWELKAQNQTDKSGLFVGAATGGSHTASGMSENLSGFAGVRQVVRPADNTQLRAEIAPRFGVSDFATPQTSATLEPKLSAESNLGQLGKSDFVGSIDASAGYNMPVQGDPSAWASMRFVVKPK